MKLRPIPKVEFTPVPLTREQTEEFLQLCLNPDKDKPLDEVPELCRNVVASAFLVKQHGFELPYKISAYFFLMSALTIADRPGIAVMILWMAHEYNRHRGKKLLGLPEWVDIFPMGVPTDHDMKKWWDSQKLTFEERKEKMKEWPMASDNLVDYKELWA